MRHRERVSMALEHERPDRCPMQVSFTPEFADRLRTDMAQRSQRDESRQPLRSFDRTGDNELDLALGGDLVLTWVGWGAGTPHHGADEYVDEWGVTFRHQPYETRFGVGRYAEMVGHPLADDTAIASYRAPDPDRPGRYAEAERAVRAFGDEYFVVGVAVTTIWETAWALRGFEQLMMDLVAEPELAESILEIPFRHHLRAAERLAQLGVDMIWTGDDVGMQTGMLISPKLWRRFLKPRMADLIARVKAINPAIKVAYHSDGMVWDIVPELVEIGLDVLNPVQPACMDPAELGRRFGDRLCFWGSIDEQHTLPFGSPDDVRAEVRTRLRTIGRRGGLILSPTHNVPLDTPLENFWAMVETIRGTPYRQLDADS